jgi:RND family efflux transporter MFP subunit
MADELSASLQSLRIDRTAKPPSKGGGKVVIWLLIAAGAVGGYVALKPSIEGALFKTQVEVTAISTVSPAQASVELTATGYVQAERTSKIAPKVPGRVAAVHVVQGQMVKAGDVLLELDPADDQASILAAQSRVSAAFAQAKGAHARVLTAEAELGEAKLRAERERKLAAQGVSAASGAEDLEARVKSLEQSLKAAQAAASASDAEASALGSQVNVLRTGLKNLTLVAPIDGKVVNKPPQIGEYVGPQPAGVSVDMGGIKVADFTTLLVETDVPETRLSMVKPDSPAEIVLDAFGAKRFRGRVKEITPLVDRAKATVVVKVSFVDAAEGVLPDMSARVSFLSKELDAEAVKAPPKTIVPGSALAERGGVRVVFVKEDDQVRMVPVKLGPAFGDGFELVEGPASGAVLIKSPPPTMKDGQKVKDKEPE